MKDQRSSWRHHYVPQFYLRQWAVAGFLWQYSRARSHGPVAGRRVSTKSTGFAPRLYTLEAEPRTSPDPDGLERRIAQIEREAANALKKLLTDGSDALNDDDKRAWSRFMSLQIDRDPQRLRGATKLADEFHVERITAMQGDPKYAVAAKLFSPEVARNLARGMLVAPNAGGSEWEKHLIGWTWTIINKRGCFITSDRPVLLDFGLATPGSVVSCIGIALSPNQLLWCTAPSWDGELTQRWFQDMEVLFNLRLVSCAPRFVYAAGSLEDPLAPKFKKYLDECMADTDDLALGADAGG